MFFPDIYCKYPSKINDKKQSKIEIKRYLNNDFFFSNKYQKHNEKIPNLK